LLVTRRVAAVLVLALAVWFAVRFVQGL